MVELMQAHQLSIMLSLSSVCIMIAVFASMTGTIPPKRRRILVYIELAAGLLMIFDRFAYIYRGDESQVGFIMVRLSNFMVFMLTLAFIHAINQYVADLCVNEIGLGKVPLRIRIVELVVTLGWLMVIISQFTGFYYYFDEANHYIRGSGYIVSYIFSLACTVIDLSVIFKYYGKLSRALRIPLIACFAAPVLAALVQYRSYGISLTNFMIAGAAVVLYVFALKQINDDLEKANEEELTTLENERMKLQMVFDQAAKAVMNAVDSGDERTKGHSLRVARYARDMAKKAGMNSSFCHEVFYSALVHDIGKMTVRNEAKGVRLTETDRLRMHAASGANILSSIEEYPFLGVAAKYHHERYDGTGVPEGLKGEQIPAIARIVAVADAYDNMTSVQEDHEIMPQGLVRERILEGSGTLFDPVYADIMVGMIDEDPDYLMRAEVEVKEEADVDRDLRTAGSLHFDEYKDTVSDGIGVNSRITDISFRWIPDEDKDPAKSIPAVIIYDSDDGLVHRSERGVKKFRYMEFAEFWFDGNVVNTRSRKIKTSSQGEPGSDGRYKISCVRYKDHAMITVESGEYEAQLIAALPETARSAYMAVTGEFCTIEDIKVTEGSEEIGEDHIPRIADPINIINLPEGTVPNIQIDGTRTASTDGVKVIDGMRIKFHTQSLPSADVVSSCPYILLFTSDNGKVNGRNYKEFACIRLDGEDVTSDKDSKNELSVRRLKSFPGWDTWKYINRQGFASEIEIRRYRGKIFISTENSGIEIKCISRIGKDTANIYAALTGERCALMDIRII